MFSAFKYFAHLGDLTTPVEMDVDANGILDESDIQLLDESNIAIDE